MNLSAERHRQLVAELEAQRARMLRRGRTWAALQLFVASAVIGLSVRLSGVAEAQVGEGWAVRIFGFLGRMLPRLQGDSLFAGRETAGSLANWFYDLPLWLEGMRVTIAMAVVGTVTGGVIALALSFFAAGNLNRHGPARLLVRRGFDAARTIPDAILALIFASAFSVGAVAGVLTLIIATVGSLGKLFSECLENADMSQVDAVRATGGSWLQEMRFGILPQLLPQILSYWLLRLEVNLTVATALGVVGAGGIGVELQRAISFTQFDTYLAILLMTVGCIFAIDIGSERLRRRIIDGAAA